MDALGGARLQELVWGHWSRPRLGGRSLRHDGKALTHGKFIQRTAHNESVDEAFAIERHTAKERLRGADGLGKSAERFGGLDVAEVSRRELLVERLRFCREAVEFCEPVD